MAAVTAPTLLYDGDCGFCTSAARLARRLSPRTAVVAWQQADLHRLGVSPQQAAAAIQLVSAGQQWAGADAVAALLVLTGGPWLLLGRILQLPGVRHLARALYRLVAANRYRLPGGTPACAVPSRPPERHHP